VCGTGFGFVENKYTHCRCWLDEKEKIGVTSRSEQCDFSHLVVQTLSARSVCVCLHPFLVFFTVNLALNMDGKKEEEAPVVNLLGRKYEPLADGAYDAIILGTGLKECMIAGMLSVFEGKKVCGFCVTVMWFLCVKPGLDAHARVWCRFCNWIGMDTTAATLHP